MEFSLRKYSGHPPWQNGQNGQNGQNQELQTCHAFLCQLENTPNANMVKTFSEHLQGNLRAIVEFWCENS